MTTPIYPSWRLDAHRSALLIVDMQVEALAATPPPQELLATIRHLRSACRGTGVPVIYLQGTTGGAIVDTLAPAEDEEVILRSGYDGFCGTTLEEILKADQVDTLIITGMHSNLACESTVRSAYDRKFNVAFPHDATAATDPTAQQSTLRTVAGFFGRVLSCGEIVNELRRSLTQ